jgi:copper chaperone CopZ
MGMTIGSLAEHCARTVELALGSVTGVRSASANYGTDRAEAEIAESVRPPDLVEVVERVGFGAHHLPRAR